MRKIVVFGLALTLALFLACSRQSSQVTKEMQTASKIAKLEQDINGKQDKINLLVQKYMQEGGKDLGAVVGSNLTPDQKAVLEKNLQNERGIGYQDLINDILKQQKEVEDLRVQIQDLEKKLPAAVVVKRGDKHLELAMEFLTKEKGLDAETAKKLALQTNLMDELVTGFKVWNFYDNGVFGTFVTQGDAPVSPYRVIQGAKQKLVTEKNVALTQRDALAAEKATLTEQVSDLEKKREGLMQDVNMLQAEREQMVAKLAEMQQLSDELKARINSVIYKLGDRKALMNAGFVKDPIFGQPTLLKFDDASFPGSVDLRTVDSINFTAEQAGVTEIRKVKIAPGSTFKIDQDYQVILFPDGKTATVKFTNGDKFRSERVAVLVN
jgi:hypothetical protein